ncbi:MAG: DUF4336 domain-containing protein, partial [bacterium]|nr:DUF4336 domain-containing protein [bacterium]
MQQLHSDLWVTDSPLRFFGVEIGARMTVIRLPGPKILLHSPIAPTPELVDEVKALGPVAYIVAPNRFHHLSVGEWAGACPEALVYAAPGLDEKRSDLTISGVLRDEPEPGWTDTVDQLLVNGFALMNEVVFFHRPSSTLIATDLAFNIGASSPPLTRLAFRMSRAYGSLSSTLVERL